MVYCLGESLLDIIITTPNDVVVRPGGAMLNAAISVGRSGNEATLISELGDDNTASLITDFLKSNNVKESYITKYSNNNTCLALAFLDELKKPSYTFIKNYPDERHLFKGINFTKNDILLFGSIYSIDADLRGEILRIIESAKEAECTIIYDPNIRHSHHLNNNTYYNSVIKNIELASIIKGSDEDFSNIFKTEDVELQINKIRSINSEAPIIITLGEKGVISEYQKQRYVLEALPTDVVSTVGAGDAFNAGIIVGILNNDNKLPSQEMYSEILNKGLMFSANVCSSMDNYIS